MLRKVVFAMVVLLISTSTLPAKEWAQKMFRVTSHDFGHLARGAKAEFTFEIQNLYEEEVHIVDVRTSCGCTIPTVTKPTLKTWEKGSIVATLNTRSYVGQRNSTMTVVIDKPFYAEVQLNIAGNIHSDVDFQPGTVAFGDVEQGASGVQEVVVTYRGHTNWQITDVRSANSNLEVELSEALRQAGQISYRMQVRLKPGAPAGTLQDQLTILTNDQKLPNVALVVEGRVVPPLTISPSPLLFGTLLPGQSAVKQLVLTGKQPFKVLSVSSDYDGLQFKTQPELAKKVHLVPVTISAPPASGEFQYTIEVQTDLPNCATSTCRARGSVRSDGTTNPTAATRASGLMPR